MEYKPDRRPIRESNLVSEQPGFFIFFLGMFFSVIVGFSVRTAAQSEWFHTHLKEAIANVGAEWRIQHGDVGLYFKDGIKPTIGLYVENVKIASESSCYMKSGGFAQRVKVPLSLIRYVMDGQLVSEIIIEDFKIEITEKTPVCNKAELPMGRDLVPVEGKKKNQITIVDRVERSHLRNEIERVRINKLEVYYPDERYDYLLMRNIVIENRSSHPKILFMEGGIDLHPFIKSNEVQKMASLKIEYNEFPEKIIKSNLLGSLREGFFSFQLVNRLDDKKFQLQAELKNVSLSLIKGLVHAVPKELNLKSNWISTKIYMDGLMNSLLKSSLEAKDVVVNGDLGEILIEQLLFSSGIASKPDPFKIRLRNINLSKAWVMVPGAKLPSQMDTLGSLNGTVDILGENHFKFDGQIAGIGAVFSAHGVRRAEKLSFGKVTAEWKKNLFSLETQNIQNNQGNIGGFVRVKSTSEKEYNVEAQLKDVQLTPSVSKLITDIDVPLVFDDIAFRARSHKGVVNYKTTVKMKSLSHGYFDMQNVLFTVSGDTSSAQEIDVKADRWQNTKQMESTLAELGVAVPTLISKPKIKVTQGVEGIQLKAEGQNGIRVTAALTGKDSLNGTISAKDQEWKVYGTRDNFKIDKK